VDAPDVNISDIHFKPVNEQTISYGLNAIKNVGTKALEHILATRNKRKHLIHYSTLLPMLIYGQ